MTYVNSRWYSWTGGLDRGLLKLGLLKHQWQRKVKFIHDSDRYKRQQDRFCTRPCSFLVNLGVFYIAVNFDLSSSGGLRWPYMQFNVYGFDTDNVGKICYAADVRIQEVMFPA
jgi:hypothetical protein